MKTDKAEKEYVDKLNDYIDKYGSNLDPDFIDMMISIELSDTVYEQHSNGTYKLNFFLILLQWLSVIINIVANVFGVHIAFTICIFNFILLGIVMVNIYIHRKAWKQARERNKCVQELVELLKQNTRLETIQELEQKYNMKFGE